jgi:transaldolase/glucose-6-phosphate isomerase
VSGSCSFSYSISVEDFFPGHDPCKQRQSALTLINFFNILKNDYLNSIQEVDLPHGRIKRIGFHDLNRDVDSQLNLYREEKIIDRIKAKDYTLWQSGPDEITNRLGWLDIAKRMVSETDSIMRFRHQLLEDGIKKVLVLGMGGSSLAPELFAKTFGNFRHGLELRILDSTDPEMVLQCHEWAEPGKTTFIVSSKSGSTAETLSLFKYFYTDLSGKRNPGRFFTAITDPGSPLQHIANDLKFRYLFLNDPNIGGRFSALSHFGLVPAALAGVDLTRMLRSAVNANWSLGLELGTIMGIFALKGIDKMNFSLPETLRPFGDWIEQLIAESTGKKGRGILPVIGEILIPECRYPKDQWIVQFVMKENTLDSVDNLNRIESPLVIITLDDLYQLGEQFFIWELATAVAGHTLHINPFDQPNVESAKNAAKQMISAYKKQGSLPEPETVSLRQNHVNAFLDQARPGDYLALQAYIPMTPKTLQLLRNIQSVLRKKTGLAVTVGFGPRFLHSTGQLHKGDRGNGLFIQLTCDARHDAAIPDQPGDSKSQISFDVLKTAQAMGDYQALKMENRRVIHFHMNGDINKALRKFLELC